MHTTWKNGSLVLSQQDIPDLERWTLHEERHGRSTQVAESLAYSKYLHEKLIDGAVFHLKSAHFFKSKNQGLSMIHLALYYLYKDKGVQVDKEKLQTLDRELIQPSESQVHHVSDAFVVGLK